MNLLSNARRWRLLPVLGVLLVPLAVAGLLTWSLAKPQDRLHGVKAAVVNEDDPVQLNGQLVPLGRQLTGKLAGNEIPSNYSWEITDRGKADEGLRDGTYAAVVTVPKNFSQAATSFSGDPAKSQKARIDVRTGDRSQLSDNAISQRVTNTAAGLLGQQLTTTYLDNIYVGFNTLNQQLGEAAHGSTQLADGSHQLADGTDKLAGGAGQLAQGSHALSQGLGQLDTGAEKLTTGTSALASGLDQMRAQTSKLPQQAGMLADVSGKQDQGTQMMARELGNLSKGLDQASQQCPPGIVPVCNQLLEQKIRAQALNSGAGQLTQASGGVSQGLNAMAGKTPGSGGGLTALAGGVDQLAGGADQLSSGMQQFHGGLSQANGGESKLAGGADQLAGGGRALADGAHKLADGNGQLSSGLGQAVQKLPTYPDATRSKLAGNVANPVETTGNSTLGSGDSAVARYAALALWIGALAMFAVLRALPARALESTRSSFALAVRNFALPAGLAVAQGILVTVVVGVVQGLSAGEWLECAGLSCLTAVSFTAVNQALVGALRNAGRFLSLLVAVVTVAAGFVAAVPELIQQLAGAVPTSPATDALQSVLSDNASLGGSVALLVVWAVVALGVTCLAVERQRTVRSASMLTKSRTAA